MLVSKSIGERRLDILVVGERIVAYIAVEVHIAAAGRTVVVVRTVAVEDIVVVRT